VFLAAVYGLPLDAQQVELFCKHTGRASYSPPPGGFAVVVAIVGRQSGKSRVASLIADYEAITAKPEEDGTELYALLIAQDHRASLRTLFRYAVAPFDRIPMLSRSLSARLAESFTLTNGITVAAYPCRPAAVRGLRARVCVADELAFFRSSENIPQDTEMLRALRPCLATTGGKLIVLSSPYGAAGALYELHRQHFGQDESETLVWVASAPEMNPTLPGNYLRRMEQDDPDAYRSEVLGEFRAGISTLFDPDSIAACVVNGRRELEPIDGVAYVGFVDASGGRRDEFTLCVAHLGEHNRVVIDVLRAWHPPFNPSGVVAEAADLLKRYRVYSITADRYGAEWVSEAFRSQGVRHLASDLDRSALYLELLAVVNAGAVEIPDDPKLLRQLRGLERRRGSSGRDRVDHPRGQHDDRANVLAGAAYLARAAKRRAIPVCFDTGPTRVSPWNFNRLQ
jgi:hypothetical protein